MQPSNLSQQETRKQLRKASEPEILDNINRSIGIYHLMALSLRTLLITLGLLAITSSTFVTAYLNADNPPLSHYFRITDFAEWIKLISLLSTVSLAALTSFNIVGKGNNARNAFRHLNQAKLYYMAGYISLQGLIRAWGEAEAILGNVDFTYQIPVPESKNTTKSDSQPDIPHK